MARVCYLPLVIISYASELGVGKKINLICKHPLLFIISLFIVTKVRVLQECPQTVTQLDLAHINTSLGLSKILNELHINYLFNLNIERPGVQLVP